jgi:Ca-activated chloride channel family protein
MKGWLMNFRSNVRQFKPALFALAFFFCSIVFFARPIVAQKVTQLPPPPPAPIYKPKPTPTPAPEELEVVRVTSNLIVVPVSVTDGNGSPVMGLQPGDFRLEEDGRAQQITQLGDPEQVPLDIALLIDVSSSVSQRFNFELQAATSFLKQVMRPADHATLFAIDRTPRLEQAPASADVATARLLNVRAATGPSPTAFYDTVVAAARYLATNTPERSRRVMVVISDGEDNFSNSVRDSAIAAYNATKDEDGTNAQSRARIRAANEAALVNAHSKAQSEVRQEVQKANTIFYSINPSGEGYKLNIISTRAQNAMQLFATATGGAAFVPAAESDLPAMFNRIASEIRSQYLIQYYSDNKSGAAAFRRINVTSPTRPQLRVRFREGYFPKK